MHLNTNFICSWAKQKSMICNSEELDSEVEKICSSFVAYVPKS